MYYDNCMPPPNPVQTAGEFRRLPRQPNCLDVETKRANLAGELGNLTHAPLDARIDDEEEAIKRVGRA